MNDSTPTNDQFKALRRGLLDFAVLSCLREKSQYAADILEKLEHTPFSSQEGTLYPLLGKLRREGFLEHEWIESSNGPPRKYHALTDKGRKHLDELNTYWQKLSSTLKSLGVDK